MKPKAIILGGGIAGLSLAWFLREKYGEEIVVLEKTERPGGWVRTHNDGFSLFELGPRSCRPRGIGAATLQLIEALGLETEVIPCDRQATERYLYWKGKLHRVPTSLGSAFVSPLTRDLIPTILQEPFRPVGTLEDESIESFMTRRYGSVFTKRLMDPLIKGIYAGNYSDLSMRSCFPQMWEWEKQHGSLLRGLISRKKREVVSPFVASVQAYPLYSFKNGMETLPIRLADRLGSKLLLQSEAAHLDFGNETVTVTTTDGRKLSGTHLYSTLPAYALAPLVSRSFPRLAAHLCRIPYLSLGVVHFGYRGSVLKKKGFGYLVPSVENERILGMVWDSMIFPQQNRHVEETRLTVMLNICDENRALTVAEEAVRRHLGIHVLPDAAEFYPMFNALPQYQVGHHAWVDSAVKECPPSLTLYGSAFYGVSINEIIASGPLLLLATPGL